MKNKAYLVLILICVISFIKLFIVNLNDKTKYYEKNEKKIGKIVYIDKSSDNIIFDLKDKNGKYRVTSYDKFNYKLGDKVSVVGIFYTPSNNTVFNLFNYRKYLLSKNISLQCNKAKITLIEKNKNIFYKVKNNIINYISNYKSYNYLNAFILGDTNYIDKLTKENLSNLGISHLLAISKMHVDLFLIIINFLFKKSRFKNTITLIFLFYFVFLTNFSISLIRCVLFFLLKHINEKFNFKVKNIHLIILVAFILLLFNSYLIYNVGFLFSVIITFFILLSSKYFSNKKYIKKTFYMSVVCFFASIPILINSFFKINLLTPFFNLIFIPIVSFVLFPFALITFILPFLDNIYLFIITLFENMCNILSFIDIFTLTISKCNLLMIIIYYIFLYLTLKIGYKYILLFILTLIININSNFLIFNTEIVYLDVGQGDSSIIIFPKGKVVLIDTGGSFYTDYSISENKIIPYLNSKGINKIDYLVLTHGDYDHMGESINLVDKFKVEKVIFNCGEFNELEQNLIEVLDKKKIPYYSCIKVLNIDDNKLYFLNNRKYDNENNNSSVIYTELDNYKFLFMGDAGVEVEEDLLEKYNIQDIDALKVGHHGSKTSSNKLFIDEVNPKHSIISVGKNNRYGHPNNEVLNNLENSKIYRTDQDGSIMFKLKNNELKIEICKP